MAEIPSEISQPTKTARRLPAWVIAVAFVALVAFLVVIGLGLKRTQAGPIAVGQTVPSLVLTTFDGSQVDTKDLAGKVIVINFWASWCVPCEQEAPALEQAWQAYEPGEQVIFLGVDWVDTEPEAKAFMQKFNVSYVNGPDLGTRISQVFRIRGVPETYVIGRDGKLAFAQIGPFNTAAEIKGIVDPLLK